MSLGQQFNRAMKLWFELTGFDPNAKSFTLGGWDLRSMNEEIKKAFKLDPSLVTSFFLLDAYSESYFKDRKVSIDDLDTDPDRVMSYLAKVKEFKALIKTPDLVSIGIQFQQKMERAMAHYNVPAEAVADLISNKHRLAFLRRDALRSMEDLRANQFLAGETDPEDRRPVYNPTVFSYWNMNSCIEHLCHMPSGISLNLIRDPDELHSYFCFTVRNGGNLIVLSDVPEYAHPLGRYMTRRPDRRYDERVSRNWFPYELLAIEYDDEGKAFHDKYREAQDKGLVPHNPQHFTLKQISELEPPVIAWTIMMFDMLVDRYWKQKPQPLPLSYTAEMIRLDDTNRLLGSAASANLPVIGYQPLSLKPLTVEDIKTDKLDKAAIGRSAATTDNENFGSKQWLEDRYGDKVADEVLNLLGVGDQRVHFITSGDETPGEGMFGSGKSLVVRPESQIKTMAEDDYRNYTRFSRRDDVAIYRMNAVDATTFGTREQIDADRKFIARINYVKGIQREADAEYAARREEIIAWVAERYKANLDELLRYCTVDEFHRKIISKGFTRTGTVQRYRFSGTSPYHYTRNDSEDRYYDFGRLSSAILNLPEPRSWEDPHCYFNDVKAFWFTAIKPRNAVDLAYMCGVEVGELPEVLRHWHNRDDDPYTGNSILDRIDPLEWSIHDPWQKETFMVKIFLSKRARTRLIKELEPPVAVTTGEEEGVPMVIRM
jgi:hypothetical protein